MTQTRDKRHERVETETAGDGAGDSGDRVFSFAVYFPAAWQGNCSLSELLSRDT